MTVDPRALAGDLDVLEQVEKATLRMVTQGILDFADEAVEIFANESDLVADIAEDITREALDRLGTSIIPVRLYGKVDYKRARYVFHPDFSLAQALFVDSKAEKIEGERTATIQLAQTSMAIRQRRGGKVVDVQGTLPKVLSAGARDLLTTTVFVKYNYQAAASGTKELASITLIALPSGFLQNRYNPSADSTFWLAGRDAPSRGEAFRVRIGITRLKEVSNWRVQRIQLLPKRSFDWED